MRYIHPQCIARLLQCHIVPRKIREIMLEKTVFWHINCDEIQLTNIRFLSYLTFGHSIHVQSHGKRNISINYTGKFLPYNPSYMLF